VARRGKRRLTLEELQIKFSDVGKIIAREGYLVEIECCDCNESNIINYTRLNDMQHRSAKYRCEECRIKYNKDHPRKNNKTRLTDEQFYNKYKDCFNDKFIGRSENDPRVFIFECATHGKYEAKMSNILQLFKNKSKVRCPKCKDDSKVQVNNKVIDAAKLAYNYKKIFGSRCQKITGVANIIGDQIFKVFVDDTVFEFTINEMESFKNDILNGKEIEFVATKSFKEEEEIQEVKKENCLEDKVKELNDKISAAELINNQKIRETILKQLEDQLLNLFK